MKISIITINLNNANGLSKTIASVKSQTYSDIEYIIIDGGSADNSLNIIKSFKQGISYWISENDKGMYHAMNKGIIKSSGDYLLFLNSGDTFSDYNVVDSVVPVLNNLDIVFGDINVMHNNRIYNTLKYPKYLNFQYFIQGALPHQGMFIKKELFLQVGLYDENLKICSDWKFQIDSICKHKCSYKHIDLIISDFLGGGISAIEENQSLIRKEKESILINEYFLFKEDLNLIKEQGTLSYYYKNSKRVNLLKRLGILKQFPQANNVHKL